MSSVSSEENIVQSAGSSIKAFSKVNSPAKITVGIFRPHCQAMINDKKGNYRRKINGQDMAVETLGFQSWQSISQD